MLTKEADTLDILLSIMGQACRACMYYKKTEYKTLWWKRVGYACTKEQKEIKELEMLSCENFKLSDKAILKKEEVIEEYERKRILERSW